MLRTTVREKKKEEIWSNYWRGGEQKQAKSCKGRGSVGGENSNIRRRGVTRIMRGGGGRGEKEIRLTKEKKVKIETVDVGGRGQ